MSTNLVKIRKARKNYSISSAIEIKPIFGHKFTFVLNASLPDGYELLAVRTDLID